MGSLLVAVTVSGFWSVYCISVSYKADTMVSIPHGINAVVFITGCLMLIALVEGKGLPSGITCLTCPVSLDTDLSSTGNRITKRSPANVNVAYAERPVDIASEVPPIAVGYNTTNTFGGGASGSWSR